jgi:Ca2+-binding EF-hand superfamily protein
MNFFKGLLYGREIDGHPAIETPNWNNIVKTSVFKLDELQNIFGRYCKICLEDGLISLARFMSQPEVASCPFAAMAFSHEMESAKSDHLNFSHYVRILDKLSPLSSALEKVEYMFDVLQIDFDNRDILEKGELSIMLKSLLGGSMSQIQLDGIVESIWNNLEESFDHEEGEEEGISRAVLTEHLCSLDLQNFITVQF